MQGITLAGLALKLGQIDSILKKQWKRNEMGYLRYVIRFDLRPTVLALGVKIYWGQALFFIHYVFYNNFRTNYPTATNLTSPCLFSWDKSSDTQFYPKKVKIKIWPPGQFGVTGQIRSKLVILGIIRFGVTRITLWYTHFIRLSPLVKKLWCQKNNVPMGL